MSGKKPKAGARRPDLLLGGHLDVEQALAAARTTHTLGLEPGADDRIRKSAERIYAAVKAREWVYGVTTGFGSNAVNPIDEADAPALQRNLLVSHAFGEGPPLPDEVVRLALLLRIHALAQGFSGIRPQTLGALMRLYEADVLAVVPTRGSVGASGDLAPLSYLALPLIGEGEARVGGRTMSARAALRKVGLQAQELSFKEGLALVNGMQVTLAIALFALEQAERLVRTADVAAALTCEALAGRSSAFDARIHKARRQAGQQESAKRLRGLLAGSQLVDAPVESIPGKRKAPQDAYGIRCAPQVHGASIDGIGFARGVFEREIDAVTDNPLVFGKDILSGGNFHGQPLALASDHLKLCIHELGSISERRVATLIDPHMNEGLPPYLAPAAGLHSGFMIPQYAAAALTSESKGLCFPASADSVPTGANIEDHVSMAPIAARRAREVGDLVESILAIELMCAAQATQLRALAPGPASTRVIEAVRTALPFRAQDRPWKDSLPRVKALIRDGTIVRAAGV
ncbi:MAG: histidine ammonia-lyase [Planctomycetota bacterium]|nr:histidine ammonia-lyase [Planctomycetota bacterium]